MTDDLIKRLESAPKGSDELDREIWLRVTPGATYVATPCEHKRTGRKWTIHETRLANGALVQVPRYTTNLQDALGLFDTIPSYYYVALDRYSDGWYAEIRPTSDDTRQWKGSKKSAAHALTIACLKALEEVNG